ncbi:rpa-associated protein [Haloferax prahovense]|uniref:rpa-associated protein n=1 Tax=Haloferax prahovense TaxID=381852 RepID=UPI003C76565A
MSASPVVGTREIAYRVFAAEFDDASLSYSESDEERAPNYVVTPTGARLNRTFVAGVLTEVEHVNDEVLRGRIADPTGAFVTYAGQYQPEPMAYLDAATPPAFVSLAGKARTYEPDDADVVYSSVRPESVNTVDADVRDRWIVSAAEATLRRIAVFDEALSMPYRGDDLTRALEARGVDSTLAAGVPRAIDHYGTTRTYLEALREVAVQALELVAGDRDQVDPLEVAPGDGGDAVLGPLPELDLEPADSVDIEVGEADADDGEALGESEPDAGEFETESDSEPAATPDTEPELADGIESEPDAEPVSEPESASEPEPVTAETTAATESQPEASEPELASEPSATVDAESEPEPAAESEPAAEPDLTSEPEPAADSLDADSEPDFDAGTDDGTLGDFEDDATDADTADTDSFGGSDDGTLGDFDDGFDDPEPEADVSAATDESATDSTDSASADADDSVDPDGMYELDEDERAEIESEFGTEFTSGADVDPAGEADIDVPDADDLTEQLEDDPADAESEPEPEPAAEDVTESDPAVEAEPEPEPTADAASDDADEDEADTDESAEDIDLESVVVDAMDDLDDGDGATRDEVVAAVVDEYGADPGAVEDAIQEALLGGRCYEPQDGVLKAI